MFDQKEYNVVTSKKGEADNAMGGLVNGKSVLSHQWRIGYLK